MNCLPLASYLANQKHNGAWVASERTVGAAVAIAHRLFCLCRVIQHVRQASLVGEVGSLSRWIDHRFR